MDSVAYAARCVPRSVRGAARAPLALPTLPAIASDTRSSLTAEQKVIVAERREQAKRRKLRMMEEMDDPMGHGTTMG